MKHKLAKAGVGIGLSLSLCGFTQSTGELEPVPVKASGIPTFETTTTIEQLSYQSKAAHEIVLNLGQTGLRLVKINDERSLGVGILLTPDGQCASEYLIINRQPDQPQQTDVGFRYYGRLNDLNSDAQLNGHAMWNGTIGHGDNVVPYGINYIPGSPESTQQVIKYMVDSTAAACAPE